MPGRGRERDGIISSGPVAVEILAEQLDLSFSQDTNFAWAGARTGRDNIFDNSDLSLEFLGFLDQIDSFAETIDAVDADSEALDVVGAGSDDPDLGLELPGLLDQIDSVAETIDAVGADSEALYLVWAGSNDFFPVGGAEVPAGPEAAVTNAVTNIATAVTTLADLGAETIVVPFLLPIDRTPLAIASGEAPVLAEIAVAFNAELEETLTSREEDLEDVDVILVDLFAITEEVVENPQEFGLSNTTDPFVSNGTILDETANAEEFFFWDATHPTTNVYEILAEVLAAEITRPVASDDHIVTPQAVPVAINVLENDSDPLGAIRLV